MSSAQRPEGGMPTPAQVRQALSLRPSKHPVHPWDRLSTLIDGIYAIAATLLVLELKPPHTQPGGLGHELLHQWPHYGVYALGFLQVAAGWTVMRRVSAGSRGVDHYATLLVLGCVAAFSLTPFTTAVLASSIHDARDFASAVRLMSVVVLMAMLFFAAMTHYMLRRGLFRDGLDPAAFATVVFLGRTALLWPLLAFAVSYASAATALAVLVVYFVLALWPIDPTPSEMYAG